MPGSTVRLAVVVPAHRQPQFLAGAVMSALASDAGDAGVGVVIVNDGCPFASTDDVARELQGEHPEQVRYLRQENRGVAGARNSGIREAIRAWPATEAIFPLDADNRLSPPTLSRLWAALRSQPEAGWAYPALELFGSEQGVWQVPGGLSAYRQLFENQCDTGALVGRDVFERGVFYDETMRDGYEDWEFYLRALRAGFCSVAAGPAGFRYRMRRRSMRTAARDRQQAIHAEIRRRHLDAFAPRALTRLEHRDLPRFTLASADGAEAVALACADLEPTHAAVQGATPITVLGTAALWELLRELRLLPGLLLRAQEALRRHPALRLTVTRDGAPDRIRLAEVAAGGETHALVTTVAGSGVPADAPALELRIGERLAPRLPPPLPAGAASPSTPAAAAGGRAATHAEFSLAKHVTRLETTFPHGGAPGEVWLVADEPTPEATALVGALVELGEAPAAHLVVTGEAGFAGSREQLDAFTTVTLLGDLGTETARLLLARTLESAGVAVIAASALGYDALPHVAPELAPVRVALAPEVERDELGVGRDPVVQAVREDEGLLDVLLAASPRAALQLENLEVVPDKIEVVALGADPVADCARTAARAIRAAAAR